MSNRKPPTRTVTVCAAIAQARREAAEEMRERCVAACESRRAKHLAAADEQWSPWDDNMAIVDLADEARECAEAIRALEVTP